MKQRYIIMVVLIGLLVILSVNLSYAQFAGGDGSEVNPFLVETANQLDAIRGSYGEYHYRQIADIDLSEYENWFPLPGHGVNTFTGSFDGNGYRILNLTIDWGNDYFVGLFRSIEEAVIKRIALENVNVTGYQYVGGLSGESYNSVIDSCYVVGNIEGRNIVGGLVGENWGGQINNSYSISVVTSTGYDSYIHGGLVGLNVGEGKINTSYAKGSVYGVDYVGGLVGSNEGSQSPSLPEQSYINNCYSTADVMGTSKVGGLVGYNYFQGIINNSYAMGTVEGNNNTGGLVGHNSYYSEINNCYSIGLVIGNDNVGGLIGSESGGASTTNSVWNILTSGQTESAGGNGVNGKKVDEMLHDKTYSDWNFAEIWKFIDFNGNPNIRKHYPVLRWQKSYTHNRITPSDAHVKVYHHRKFYWDSFPRLEQQDNHPYTAQVLFPLAGTIFSVEAQGNQSMSWHPIYEWSGHSIGFNSTKGYILGFDNSVTDEHYLWVNGNRISIYEEITLEPHVTNFVGYFISHPQKVFDSFGTEVISQLRSVEAEDWSLHWLIEDEWMHRAFEPSSSSGTLFYGKMYKVRTRTDNAVTFSWNLPPGYPELYPKPKDPIPRAKHFDFEEGAGYESIFIEDIENDHDIIEVAVYVDEECIGASPFLQDYPLEILAYTDESHYGEEISFVILRDDKSGEPERIRIPQVMNIETGEFSPTTLRPRQQKFSVVRLSADDYETEAVPSPEIILSQNYPNPILIGSAKRSNLTEIPFYVSEAREVSLTIYNIRGQLVKNLYSGNVNAGKHSLTWDSLNEYNRSVGSGVYFYRLESGDTVITRKMLIIR